MIRALASLALVGCSSWWQTGSAVRERCTHLGVRAQPESLQSLETRDWTVSVRATTDWPACREVYR